jgi:putative hydrolase of the HAD superfamily
VSKKIEAIVFDLGGVLYDIDIQKSVQAFDKLGLKHFDEQYNLKEQSGLFDALELGKLTEEEFARQLNTLCKTNIPAAEVARAWNALLIQFPAEHVEMLHCLERHYKLYLLSNTNQIHLEAIDIYMELNYQLTNLDELFDKTYYSFKLGMRKPSRDIYDFVIKDAQLDPASTLFIDDNEDNIKGALESGFAAVHKPKHKSTESVLKIAGINW